MSKVYSFRLSDDNPREAQAREVIDAWVSKGYSLNQIIISALNSYQNEEKHNDELEEILRKITHLFEGMNGRVESIKFVQETLPEAFVGSISKSVKRGIKIE